MKRRDFLKKSISGAVALPLVLSNSKFSENLQDFKDIPETENSQIMTNHLVKMGADRALSALYSHKGTADPEILINNLIAVGYEEDVLSFLSSEPRPEPPASSRKKHSVLKADRIMPLLLNETSPGFSLLMDHFTWYADDPWYLKTYTTPLRYHYSSGDPVIAAEQNSEKQGYGVNFDIVSWWGPPVYSYRLFKQGYLQAENFSQRTFCFLYEIWGRLVMGNDSHFNSEMHGNQESFLTDLLYLKQNYFDVYDNYYRIDGKPVLYCWWPNLKNFENTRRQINDFLGEDIYFIGSESMLFPPEDDDKLQLSRVKAYDAVTSFGISPTWMAGEFGGWLTIEAMKAYACGIIGWDRALKVHSPHTEIILPIQFAYCDKWGYFDQETGKTRVLQSTPEQVDMFAKTVRFLADLIEVKRIHVTSYNEHFEGHGFEPSVEYGDLWFRTVKKYFAEDIVPEKTWLDKRIQTAILDAIEYIPEAELYNDRIKRFEDLERKVKIRK